MKYDGPERRTAVRMSPKGTVSIRCHDYDVRGRLANVSGGGLCAITLVTAPERVHGRTVDIELRFDTQQSEWVQLSGRIVRVGPTSIALSFNSVPDGFVELIDETLTASLNRKRLMSILMVDATLDRRLRLAEAFRSAGCAVLDVSSPLEAIVRLGEYHFEPDIVAIADSLPDTVSSELRAFVTHEHPRAKQVTIGDQITEPDGLEHWLSSLDPGDDLAARVRRVLFAPRR